MVNVLLLAGPVIVAVGAVFVIESVMVAVPVEFLLSFTVNVIVCIPTGNEFRERGEPDPIAPTMLEDQLKADDPNRPSSASEPEPWKLIYVPDAMDELFAGLVIVAVGAVFVTVRVMNALPVTFLLSFTVKNMVCVPIDKEFMERGDPDPKAPSILDDQLKTVDAKGPSSASEPDP